MGDMVSEVSTDGGGLKPDDDSPAVVRDTSKETQGNFLPHGDLHPPQGLMPPIDQTEVASCMFSKLCALRGWLPLTDEAVDRLGNDCGELLYATYLGLYIERDEEDCFDFSIIAGAKDPEGNSIFLVTITDTQTGNFLLPVLQEPGDRDVPTEPEGQGNESKTTTQYLLEGGAPNFQGLLVRLELRRFEGEERRLLISDQPFMTRDLMFVELSRIAQGDFRGGLYNQLEANLRMAGTSSKEIVRIRPSNDLRYPVTSLRLLIDVRREGSESLRTLYLNVGDFDDGGALSAPAIFPFLDPGDLAEDTNADPSDQSESLLSAIEELASNGGSIGIEGAEAEAFYQIAELERLIESALFDVAHPVWSDAIQVRAYAPRIARDGKLRFLVSMSLQDQTLEAIEGEEPVEGSEKNYIPWLTRGVASALVGSDSVLALLAEVALHGISFNQLKKPLSAYPAGTVSVAFPCAIVSQGVVRSEVEALADREVMEYPLANGMESSYREGPSAQARESIFFPEIHSLVCDDLEAIGIISAAQRQGVQLRNIQVSHGMRRDTGEAVDLSSYFVHVEHRWGTHVLRISHLEKIGLVNVASPAVIDGFFPKHNYCEVGDDEV